jgi:hypothetical protein
MAVIKGNATGQITLEFLMAVGFLFFISFAAIAVIGYLLTNYSETDRSDMVVEFGESIKKEIEVASAVKDGYERSVTLPAKIGGLIDYDVSTSASTLVVSTDYQEYTAIIPEVQGTLAIGQNTITKDNGIISISS